MTLDRRSIARAATSHVLPFPQFCFTDVNSQWQKSIHLLRPHSGHSLLMHLAAGGAQCVAAARTSRGCVPLQAARGPDGFSSVEAYDKERLKLDAQVSRYRCTAVMLKIQQFSQSSKRASLSPGSGTVTMCMLVHSNLTMFSCCFHITK